METIRSVDFCLMDWIFILEIILYINLGIFIKFSVYMSCVKSSVQTPELIGDSLLNERVATYERNK